MELQCKKTYTPVIGVLKGAFAHVKLVNFPIIYFFTPDLYLNATGFLNLAVAAPKGVAGCLRGKVKKYI